LSRNGLKRTKEYRAFHPLQVGKGRWKTNKKLTPSEEAPNFGPQRLGGERLELYRVAEVGLGADAAAAE
jgi:hypothetical protein